MVSLTHPSAEAIRAFLASQSEFPLTYASSRGDATEPPPGYVVDHTRARIGRGEEAFARAKAALERWQQVRLGWVEARPDDAPIRTGQEVAIVARRFGVWWLSACRIVRVLDDPGPGRRFGFAYGTLPDHVGIGEERFLVEWDRSTGEVWYDILAFSRPNWLVSRIFYGYMRRLQRRFGRDSAAAMKRLVGGQPDRPIEETDDHAT
ncbi:hypothetical protein OJF2_61950 [Aquisphaera giovannonii]|uniref:DUF1990 domain-containing protein n=1 Tax=Aquisphaera giovannonii TaxID=406548 RepID=A0A5B9WBG4_9BACT|nr:DUF1990 domain-containing protein [Aquisphaera giovannonii]QEH37604.1 hypothetical protein OJF2_61950 [Aquisphaera giovannonii]